MIDGFEELKPGIKVETTPSRWAVRLYEAPTALFTACLNFADSEHAFVTLREGGETYRLRAIKASGVRQAIDGGDSDGDRWDLYLFVRKTRTFTIGERRVDVALSADAIAEFERILGAPLPREARVRV